MKTRFLGRADLDPFVLDLLNSGIRVIAPLQRKEQGRTFLEYGRVQNSDEMILDGTQPVRPLKEIVFPSSEILFKWKRAKSLIQIEEKPPSFEETVVIGASPCDAAALEIVDRVMGWDYRDDFWFGRREATTILTVACNQADSACFCPAMGLSPESTRGADWYLVPADGGFHIEILSSKGELLLERFEKRLSQSKDAGNQIRPAGKRGNAEPDLPIEKIRTWLKGHFEDPLWKEIALPCHGCGACTFVCPACHCFDIVDEPEGTDCGTRRRNWDACQPALFTLHASGHNPRKDQTARYRQRILHKFSIYPERFGEMLCTGCGRCIRVCAGGVDLIAILEKIGKRAEADASL